MGLALGVKKGDRIQIGDHCLEVKAIASPPNAPDGHLITVAVDGGDDILISSRAHSKVLPDVFVYSGTGATGRKKRLAIDAPPSVRIRRVTSEAAAHRGETSNRECRPDQQDSP